MKIQDLFKIDLNKVENSDFDTKTEDLKKNVVTYSKELDYIECGLYNSFDVIFINGKPENLVFKGDDIITTQDEIIKFVNNIYAIVGHDEDGDTKMSSYDKEQLEDEDVLLLYNWEMNNIAFNVLVDGENNSITFTIHGYKNL